MHAFPPLASLALAHTSSIPPHQNETLGTHAPLINKSVAWLRSAEPMRGPLLVQSTGDPLPPVSRTDGVDAGSDAGERGSHHRRWTASSDPVRTRANHAANLRRFLQGIKVSMPTLQGAVCLHRCIEGSSGTRDFAIGLTPPSPEASSGSLITAMARIGEFEEQGKAGERGRLVTSRAGAEIYRSPRGNARSAGDPPPTALRFKCGNQADGVNHRSTTHDG